MKFLFDTFQFQDVLDDAFKSLQHIYEIFDPYWFLQEDFKYVRAVFEHALTIQTEFNVHEMI